MPTLVYPNGPLTASIYAVGEAPGACETCECNHSYHRVPAPFVGASGHLLDQLLAKASVPRETVRVGNVALERPPGNDIGAFFGRAEGSQSVLGRDIKSPLQHGLHALYSDLRRFEGNLVLALGNAALWALTGRWGITHWRGSELSTHAEVSNFVGRELKVVPTYHPAAVLRQWELIAVVQADVRRAVRESATPTYEESNYFLTLAPGWGQAAAYLEAIWHRLENATEPVPLAVDLETFGAHIECVGIAVSARDSIVIPLLGEAGKPYWPLKQEIRLWEMLRALLTHPHAAVIGQNFNYDAQFFAARLGWVPHLRHDTMVMQSVFLPGMLGGLRLTASGEAREKRMKSRSLDFLASLHCRHYRQWKLADVPYNTVHKDYHAYWRYAAQDVCATFEIAESLLCAINRQGLLEQYNFQMRFWWSVLRMTLRGIRIDLQAKTAAEQSLEVEQAKAARWLDELVTEDLLPRGRVAWYKSPKATMRLLYEVLGEQPVMRDRKDKYGKRTRTPTADDEALAVIGKREPLLRPLCDRLLEYRRLGTVHEDLVSTVVDEDGRVRSSFDIASAETYRLTSRKTAFGTGRNLQNIVKVVE